MACTCAGCVDASLKLAHALGAPAVSGDLRLSRGTAYLMQQSGTSSTSITQATPQADRDADLVLKAFSVLARKDGFARQLSRLDMLPSVRPVHPRWQQFKL